MLIEIVYFSAFRNIGICHCVFQMIELSACRLQTTIVRNANDSSNLKKYI